MTLWQRILQGVVALTTSTGISMLTGVVSAVLTFRYLTPDEYGRLALFISYYSTGTIFLTLGLDAVVTSELARARGEKRWSWIRYLLQWYGWMILSSGVLLVTIFFTIGEFANQTVLWRIMGLYLFLTAPNRFLSIIFHSTTRYRRFASLNIVRSVSRMGLLFLLPIWWPGETIVGIAFIFPILEVMVFMTALYLLQGATKELTQPDDPAQHYSFQNIRSLIQKEGVYTMLSIPIKTVSDQMPLWFLRVMIGETAVGIFAAAQRTYLLILSVFRTIETTLFPLVAEQKTKAQSQLQIALRQAQKYTFWAGLFVILTSMILARPILTIIAGEAYIQAIPIFRIIVWHLLFFAFSQAQRPLFFAHKAQKWLFSTYTFGVIIGIIVYPVTIYQLGIMGSAIGFLSYNGSVIFARQAITRHRIPEFYISPNTIFQIEPFDRQLYKKVSKKLFRK